MGFCWSKNAGHGIHTEAMWADPLCILLPGGHALAKNRLVTLKDIARLPMLLPHPDLDPGCREQIDAILHLHAQDPVVVAEVVNSFGVLVNLVAAGCGVGFSFSVEIPAHYGTEVVTRPILEQPALTTFALRLTGEPIPPLARFLERARSLN